jgi:hypothetical protein
MDRVIRSASVGLVAGMALVIFGPPLLRAARPLIRQAIKAAVVAYGQGRETLAHIAETAEDAYAEAASDMAAEAVAAENEAAAPASANSRNGVRA